MNEYNQEVLVCTKHLRHIPCRPCLANDTDYYSSHPDDIDMVNKYQRGEHYIRPEVFIAWNNRPTGPLSDLYLTSDQQAEVFEWLLKVFDDAYTDGYCEAEGLYMNNEDIL